MPLFPTITLIGAGLVGGSLGIALKRRFPHRRILGVDHADTLKTATQLGAIDEGFSPLQMNEAVAQSDLIFLCTPIKTIQELFPQIQPALKKGALVTDVGSTKREIVQAAHRFFFDDIYFLGGHPMTGSENKGIVHADPLLFENAIYVLTPSQAIPKGLIRDFGNLLETIGAKVLFLSPALHDRIAAAVSHLPQLLSVGLMNLVAGRCDESPHYLKLAAGGFRDMTRIASSPFSMWHDIVDTNRDEIALLFDAYIEELRALQKSMQNGGLATRFKSAAQNRLSIPRDTRGFLRPHFDLLVLADDKPGVIARMSGALAKEEINIKDIEVVKVKEGDTGSIRIALETEAHRQRALTLFQEMNLEARIRE